MSQINQDIIGIMAENNVPADAIERYRSELSVHNDNLEVIGCYWSIKIAQINVNIRPHADVCIFLRDTSSELLWLDLFRNRVIPIILEYGLFSK